MIQKFNNPPGFSQTNYNGVMQNSKIAELHTHYIGSVAMEALCAERTATLFSVTSQGIFLLFHNQRMIFLSFENYRGPLTVTLPGGKPFLSNLSPEETISIFQQGIRFLDSGVRISTSKAKVWNPPLPGDNPIQPEDRTKLIHPLAIDVHQRKPEAGMRNLLPYLVGFNQEDLSLDDPFKELRIKMDRIGNQLAPRDWHGLGETLISLLGMGSGLTPSGDDFILGILLILNRWGFVFFPGHDLSTLNKNVVAAAYRGTTTLSANLIECATLGLADERLIQAVDYLVVGNSQQSAISAGLLSWGNSSGVDALAGMIAAFIHS